MAVIGGYIHTVCPGTMRGTVVRPLRRIKTESHDITGIARIVTQRVPDLALGKTMVSLFFCRIINPIPVNISQKCGGTGIPQGPPCVKPGRSEEHTSELQSRPHLVCRLLLEKKKHYKNIY